MTVVRHPGPGAVYAFTGPEKPPEGAREIIRSTIADLREPCGFRFGGANGVDTECAWACHDIQFYLPRTLVKPAARWSNVVPPGTEVEDAMPGKHPADSYMIRNTQMVGPPCTCLVAFPLKAAEPRNFRAGGGTWATVRRARKRGLPIYIVPLDGSPPFWDQY